MTKKLEFYLLGPFLAKERVEGMLTVMKADGCIENYEMPNNPIPLENIDMVGLIAPSSKRILKDLNLEIYKKGACLAKCIVKNHELMERTYQALLKEQSLKDPYCIIPFLEEEIDKV